MERNQPVRMRAAHEIDETDAIVSACECTGMLPTVPEEEDTEVVRRMMHVHLKPREDKERR